MSIRTRASEKWSKTKENLKRDFVAVGIMLMIGAVALCVIFPEKKDKKNRRST